MGRLASSLLGSGLAWLYTLHAPPQAEEGDREESERARANLATLAEAQQRMDGGDLRGALTTLEALTGACQEVAAPWLERMRAAVLWQQTFRALHAKALCLNG
ncbi:unnamed protein product [Effrenium voratum]|nr:unnamed protein product [Effrenium voratum]